MNMIGYYDYVLGFIPIALLGGSGLFTAAGLPTTTAVALGAAVSFLVVAHALFVNGPVDETATLSTISTTSTPSGQSVNAD